MSVATAQLKIYTIAIHNNTVEVSQQEADNSVTAGNILCIL